MKLEHVIKRREIYCASTGQTVQEVAEFMTKKGIGAVPVLDNNNIVGIFTERDLLCRVVAKKKNPKEVKVETVMTKELILASPDSDIKEAIFLMKKYNIRHIPVVKDKELVGIISLRDLLQVEIEDREFDLRVLHEYVHYIPPYAVTKKLS